MSDITRAWRLENLRLAWSWLRSNPDAAFKSHFRELYTAYALADERLLRHLSDRLRRRVFEPSDACKIFFPKPSGILRPYTLPVIEDQIVYQAMANIVAEKLSPHVRARYNKEVFGHMYAGTGSPWFYRRWSDGYKAFNKTAETAFSNGYVWTASFDLTAFYDSIDHHVLCQMLRRIGVDQDLQERLTECLSKWTATSTQIYHNHGIPQGPLSSGLIAEVVLKHFDDLRTTRYDVKYLRYVDDIRLFAKKEAHLRHALVSLDRLSKDVGLFPQSGKIDIHVVKDITQELNSISNPIEPVLATPAIDQKALRKRIVELTPRYRVASRTRFKYLIGRATPSVFLADRLWRVFEHAPHYYPQLSGHLEKFKVLHRRHARRLLDELETQELYPAVQAALIGCAVARVPTVLLPTARKHLKAMWKPRTNQPDLSDALWRWLNRERHFTDAQLRYGVQHLRPAWLHMRSQFGIDWTAISRHQRENWLNHNLRVASPDVAITAGLLCAMHGVAIQRPIRGINAQAKLVLKELGLIRRSDASVCGIQLALKEMTGDSFRVDWRRFFGRAYKRAEAQIVTCKACFKTNPSAWVNSLDVFIDLMLDALYRHNTSALGTYTLGHPGSVTSSKRLRTHFPHVATLLNQVHAKRLESDLSHPVVRSTSRPTRPVRYRWLRTGTRLLRHACRELRDAGY